MVLVAVGVMLGMDIGGGVVVLVGVVNECVGVVLLAIGDVVVLMVVVRIGVVRWWQLISVVMADSVMVWCCDGGSRGSNGGIGW